MKTWLELVFENMRRLFLVAFFYCSFAGACSALTIQFQAPDEYLRGSEVTCFSTRPTGWGNVDVTARPFFLGLVEDFHELSDGQHFLSITGPRSEKLEILVEIKEGGLVVLETHKSIDDCENLVIKSWDPPIARRSVSYPGRIYLRLSNPVTEDAMEITLCQRGIHIPTFTKRAVVTIQSEPEGGEIWIDGERTEVTTNGTVSIPYAEFGSSSDTHLADVLVRSPDRVNCRKVIELQDEETILVSCDLPLP